MLTIKKKKQLVVKNGEEFNHILQCVKFNTYPYI